MRSTLARWREVLLLTATAASLGFGARQAVAAPQAEPQAKARVCWQIEICKPECGTFGGEYRGGRCICCG